MEQHIQCQFGSLRVWKAIDGEGSSCRLSISDVSRAAIGHWQCSPGPSDKEGYVLPSEPLYATIEGYYFLTPKYNLK